MTSPQPEFIGPRIEIHLGAGGVDIHQQRPAIARALVGLPVSVALQRIPGLLPICGGAQAVAAARAVAAAATWPASVSKIAPAAARQRSRARIG